MEQYIARQPIFTGTKKLYAYELLYRGTGNIDPETVSGNMATASLLSSAFLTKDINDISSNHPCFVNFTQDLLEKNLPSAFPKNKIVVEVLENVEPTKKVIAVCRSLAEKGYTIALDDFTYHPKFAPLLEFAKIVKIDIRLTPLSSLERTLKMLSGFKIKLLAEKVETLAEFDQARGMGFHYFQGYFFCKPEKIKFTELSSTSFTLLRLLSEVVKKDNDIEKIREIIETDVAISYKLLRFMNSSYFYRLQEVKSIDHAIAYLGERELRRFVMLVIISELSIQKPQELVRLALVRAKFCELLGVGVYSRSGCAELFMMGLFSLLDAMLDTPLEDILAKLPIGEEVKNALLQRSNVHAKYLKIAIAFERNQEKIFNTLIAELRLEEDKVQNAYLEAIKYSSQLL